MKHRKLRKEIEWIIIIILIFQFLLLGVDDMTNLLKGILFELVNINLIIFNMYILNTYGTGVAFDKEEK